MRRRPLRRVCAATLAHIDRLALNFGSTDKLDSLKEHLQACQFKAESDRYNSLLTAQDAVTHERRQQRKAEQSYNPNYDQTRRGQMTMTTTAICLALEICVLV